MAPWQRRHPGRCTCSLTGAFIACVIVPRALHQPRWAKKGFRTKTKVPGNADQSIDLTKWQVSSTLPPTGDLPYGFRLLFFGAPCVQSHPSRHPPSADPPAPGIAGPCALRLACKRRGVPGLRDDKFKAAGSVLSKIPYNKLPFPDDGPERIIRRGILTCSQYTTPACNFVLLLPANTRP